MLFKSQVYTVASGSIGGVTYARNRFGMYTRSRSVPVNPNSTAQNIVRNFMRTLSETWVSVLTPAQRDAWDSYAAAVPWTNRIGETVYLTGLNMFLRSNALRMRGGLASLSTAPAEWTLAQMTGPSITAAQATQEISLAYTNSDPWAEETGGAMFLFTSPPQNPSINFYRGPYRYAGVVLGDTTTPPTSPEVIASPFTFAVGQRIFARVMVARADGRASTPFRTFGTGA